MSAQTFQEMKLFYKSVYLSPWRAQLNFTMQKTETKPIDWIELKNWIASTACAEFVPGGNDFQPRNTAYKNWIKENLDQINRQDERGETLLHTAVRANKIEWVKLLTELGAKSYLSNNEFDYPFQLNKINTSIGPFDFNDLNTLNSMNPIPPRAEVRHYLKTILAHCMGIILTHNNQSDTIPAFDPGLIQNIVSRLLGVKINELLNNDSTKVKLPAHLFNIGMSDVLVDPKKIKDQGGVKVDVEGFYASSLIPITFYALFTSIVEMTLEQKTVDALKLFEELVICFEMNLLLTFLSVHNRISGVCDVPHSRHSTFTMLAKKILNKLKQLEEGDELSLPSGWSEHSLYLNFLKKDGRFFLRIDNLGMGCNESFTRHGYSNSTNQARPHLAILKDFSQSDQAMLEYLTRVLSCSAHLISHQGLTGNSQAKEAKRGEILKALYVTNVVENAPVTHELLEIMAPFMTVQRAGNCVYKSLTSCLQVRLRETLLNSAVNGSYVRLLKRYEKPIVEKDCITWPALLTPVNGIINALMRESYKTRLVAHRVLGSAIAAPIIAPYFQNLDQGSSDNKLISVFDLFSQSVWDPKKPFRLQVSSPGGMGKSTLCRFLADQWCQNKDFLSTAYDALIWLPFRHMNQGGPSRLVDFVEAQCFDRALFWYEKQALEDIIADSKTLWSLDGFDELVLSEQTKIMIAELAEKQRILVTSRPNQTLPMSFKFQQCLGLSPFTDEDIKLYAQEAFSQPARSAAFLSDLFSSPMLHEMAHTPISLNLLCNLWANDAASLKQIHTLTQLHQRFVDWSLKNAFERQYPECKGKLSQTDSEQLYTLGIKTLERMAFDNLQSERHVSLQANIINEVFERACGDDTGLHDALTGKIGSLGLCVLNKEGGEFVHPTSQEFFAARFLVRKLMKKSTSSQNIAIGFIRKHKFDANYQVVFTFVAGLLSEEKSNEIKRHADKRQVALNAFFTLLCAEPFAFANTQRQQVRLLMQCFEETRCHSTLTLTPQLSALMLSQFNTKLHLAALFDSGMTCQMSDFQGKVNILETEPFLKATQDALNVADEATLTAVLRNLTHLQQSVPLNTAIIERLLALLSSTGTNSHPPTAENVVSLIRIMHANLDRLIADRDNYQRSKKGSRILNLMSNTIIDLARRQDSLWSLSSVGAFIAEIFEKISLDESQLLFHGPQEKTSLLLLFRNLFPIGSDGSLHFIEELASSSKRLLSFSVQRTINHSSFQPGLASSEIDKTLQEVLHGIIVSLVKLNGASGNKLCYGQKRLTLLNTLLKEHLVVGVPADAVTLFRPFFSESELTQSIAAPWPKFEINAEALHLLKLSSLRQCVPDDFFPVFKYVWHFANQSYALIEGERKISCNGNSRTDYNRRDAFARQITLALKALGHLSVAKDQPLSQQDTRIVELLYNKLNTARGVGFAARCALRDLFDIKTMDDINTMKSSSEPLVVQVAARFEHEFSNVPIVRRSITLAYHHNTSSFYPNRSLSSAHSVIEDEFIQRCVDSTNEQILCFLPFDGNNKQQRAQSHYQHSVSHIPYKAHQLSVKLLIRAYCKTEKIALLKYLETALVKETYLGIELRRKLIIISGERVDLTVMSDGGYKQLFDCLLNSTDKTLAELYQRAAIDQEHCHSSDNLTHHGALSFFSPTKPEQGDLDTTDELSDVHKYAPK